MGIKGIYQGTAAAVALLLAGSAFANLNPLVLGDLPPGKTITITFDADIAAGNTIPGITQVQNQATLTGDSGALASSDDPATVAADDPTITVLDRESDLSLTKTESTDPAIAGVTPGVLTYVVTLNNDGPNDATNITVSEALTLPAGVTITSITPSVGTYLPANSPNGTWTVPSLADSANATLTVVLSVADATADGTDVISDTAAITGFDGVDSNSANDSVTESTSVTHAIDVRLTKTESADPIVAGSANLTYVVTATNHSGSSATGLEITEAITVPAGATLLSVTPSAGTYAPANAANGVWTLGTLAGGNTTATLTVVIQVSSSAAVGTDVISDTATVTATDIPLLTPASGTVTESTSVSRSSNLSITKTDGVDNILAGGSSTYIITVGNTGPSDATAASVTDNFPAAIDSVTWTCVASGSASCTAGPVAGNINTTVNIPVGDSVTFSADADVDPAALGSVVNTATVAAPAGTTDPVPGNNSATDTNSIVFDPPSGTKVANQTGGFEAEWKMVWINSGNLVANTVRVVDPLPASTTYVPGSVNCDALGSSTIDVCEYQPGLNQIVYEGDIGPDPMGTNENDSNNEVVITFRTRIPTGEDVENIASANWDEDGDGNVDDDAAVQTPTDASFVLFVPQVIPALTPLGLLILMMMMGITALRGKLQREERS